MKKTSPKNQTFYYWGGGLINDGLWPFVSCMFFKKQPRMRTKKTSILKLVDVWKKKIYIQKKKK
jgi:hypothetical protein